MSLPIDLSRHVALVTGARGGIGTGIVDTLRRCGATVVAADLPDTGLLDRDTDSVHWLALDVTDERGVGTALAQVATRFAHPTIVVNNAGVASRVGLPFTRLDVTDWGGPWSVNVVGSFAVAKAAVPGMIEAGGGTVVNIASVSGRTGFPTSPPYSASKAAVINLTQVMARDLAVHGIRVNAVCPGMVLTPFYRAQRLAAAEADPSLHDISDEEYFDRKATQLIPLGRGQSPLDIGAAVAFLASDLAANITGQALNVDGGLVMS